MEEASLRDKLQPNDSYQWEVEFAHVAQDLEVDCFASFYAQLYGFWKRQNGANKLWWSLYKEGGV